MSRLGFASSVIAIWMSLAISAMAQGIPAEGAAIAEKWCARCHNVSPMGAFKLQPPSFAAIAVYRSRDQIYGRIAYPNIHMGMPQLAFILTPEGIENLVAYIVSLEKTKP